MGKFILDDRHEVFNIYKSQCSFCKHYLGNYTCPAFPDELPDNLMTGESTHNTIIKGQKGNYTYSPQDEYENYKPWEL
jgi:hypothetical protein